MTRVSLKLDDGRYSVVCEGHAVGSVKVCAAVSTLIYTLLGYLKNAGDISVESEEIADGYAEVEFSGGHSARVVFEFISIGFMQIERVYPNFVQVF